MNNPVKLVFLPPATRIFLLLSVLLSSCTSQSTNPASARPNVLFILVDDLGMHDLGITGSTFYETPNIDKLASESFVFTQGYANSRVCSPSRASIFTGQFTARHQITDWIGAKNGKDWRTHKRHDKMLPATYKSNLPHKNVTMAEAFKAAGYQTFFAGKWHLGNQGSYPEDHGFDINVGGWEKGSPIGGYFSPWQNPNLLNKAEGENLSMRLAKETASFIKGNTKKPFFAFLSFYAVHSPIETTEEKWLKYREKAITMGIDSIGFNMEKKLPIRKNQDNPVYAGLVSQMDAAVGIVLDELRNRGLEDNTLVIFTSDNGGVASGDNFSTSNAPLRGGKGYQWEGGIREPYFIRATDMEIKEISYPVSGADFYPTLLDLANLPLLPAQHKDGISLKPLMEEKTAIMPKRSLYWHYPHYGNQGGDPSSIIRKDKWKLIHYWEDNHNELYDLNTDPGEQKDLTSVHKDISSKLWVELREWLRSVEAVYPAEDPLYDDKKATEFREDIQLNLLPELELKRKQMYSKTYSPNLTWWNSKTTVD